MVRAHRQAHPFVAVAALAAGALVLTSVAAQAATPTDGSVSDTSTSTSWTAGPFAVPNVTGTAGDITCSAATPCDDYTLKVDTPAGYGDGHQLKVSVDWTQAAADFDIYLLDANGNVVSSSASSAKPETMIVPPDAGTYTVRVVPYAPLGDSIQGTATLTSTSPDPAPSTATRPTFGTYTPPDSLSADVHNAGEPSIGVNHQTGAVMYQAYTSTFKATFDDSTSPATATWHDVSANATNGCLGGSTTSLDPILFTDSHTGRTFESQLAGKTALTCYTDDDGTSWHNTSGSGINSGVDHQTIGGGPLPAGASNLPTTSYPNAVYYCSQDIADASCARSLDGGTTYGPAVPMYSLLDCGGLHGHVKVAPDGTVYVPNKGCGANQAVAVSTDAGTTWSVRPNPASTPGDSDPSVGVGSGGTVYMGYQAADGSARVAVSHDQGRTWQHDQNVGAQLGVKNAVFPAVTAGDDDRAAFAFIGTTTGGNYQDQANFTGVWHLYVATTYDGGQTWGTVDVTPNDPVQRGSICTGGTTCGNDRNLLDFMDITTDADGRVLVGYADGCTGACAGGGAQNYDALASIARQSGGLTLRAAADPQPNLTVSSLSTSLSPNRTGTATAVLTNTGGAIAKGSAVRILLDGVAVGTSTMTDLAPGESRTVTLSLGSRLARGSSHSVLAVADPDQLVAESDEADNKRATSVTVR
ncbi:MAG TPA: CARDB domain-containing protein [Angustibacter sp.]|nr:CARDB domain-containing protein [Angustibacter sp.]